MKPLPRNLSVESNVVALAGAVAIHPQFAHVRDYRELRAELFDALMVRMMSMSLDELAKLSWSVGQAD